MENPMQMDGYGIMVFKIVYIYISYWVIQSKRFDMLYMIIYRWVDESIGELSINQWKKDTYGLRSMKRGIQTGNHGFPAPESKTQILPRIVVPITLW